MKALAAVTGVATAASGLIGRDVIILSASSGAAPDYRTASPAASPSK